MSGTGFAPLVASPFVDGTGRLTPWAGQFLQQFVAYVGPAPKGGSTTNESLTEQIAALAQSDNTSTGAQGASGAQQQQIQDLQRGMSLRMLPPAPPAAPRMMAQLVPLGFPPQPMSDDSGAALALMAVGETADLLQPVQDPFSAAVAVVSAFGATGTVSSVGLTLPSMFAVAGSPITGSGTLTVTFTNQVANSVLAGPSSGPSAAPTFRALTAADLSSVSFASLPTSPPASGLLWNNGGYLSIAP